MRDLSCVCLLLAGMAFGQTAQPPTPPAGAKAESGATAPGGPATPAETPKPEVAPNEPVITVKGFCSDGKQGDTCKTVITRAEFDKLVDALQPNMPPAVRRNLANKYTTMLRMAMEAEKRGLDKQAKFAETMRFARMQILSLELSHALQEEAGNISDADLNDYYKQNQPAYEQATIAKIFVSHTKQIPASPPPKPVTKSGVNSGAKAAVKPMTAPTEAQRKADEEAMKKVSTDLQARLVKGEDPDKLQKEAYVAAGLPGNPPPTQSEKVRRNTLPASHKDVMDLKAGEVSQVIPDASGYYIYKVIRKDTLPLDDVKAEIRSTLSSKRYRDSMNGYQNNADLNDAYFGPTQSQIPAPRRGSAPPPDHAVDPD